MRTRFALAAITSILILVLLAAAGCGDDDPATPAGPDTTYDYCVLNATGIDFEVFRISSLTGGEFEYVGEHAIGEEVAYESHVGVGCDLRFCYPDSGPDVYRVMLSYLYDTPEDRNHTLRLGGQ